MQDLKTQTFEISTEIANRVGAQAEILANAIAEIELAFHVVECQPHHMTLAAARAGKALGLAEAAEHLGNKELAARVVQLAGAVQYSILKMSC